MTFKEYVARKDETVLDILKGTGNLIKGTAQTGAGLLSVGDEALAKAMGQGTKGRMTGGFRQIGTGLGNIGYGTRQALIGSSPNSGPRIAEPKTSRNPQKDEIFILSPIANSSNVGRFIEKIYQAHKEDKSFRVVDAREFIKNILISYSNYKLKNPEIGSKLAEIMHVYFSTHKVKKIKTLEDKNIEVSPENILKIKKYIDEIIFNMTNSENSTYLPEKPSAFKKELAKIHNEVLSTKNFNKNMSGTIRQMRNEVLEVLRYYFPENGY